MRHLASLSRIALAAAVLAGVPLLAAEKPTPTPKPKAARKLGGGSFGTPPAPTPTPGGSDTGSLADVVRKTQEEPASADRKPTRKIVITNESLRRPEPTPSGASVTITGGAGSKPVVTLPPEPTPTPGFPSEYRDASGRTEAEWRGRAEGARQRVEQADADLAAAQEEARRLENDFYAWSDGNYRERVIRPAWDKAKERVKHVEDEVVKAREGLAALEEEARKSGTPPGWLR